MKKLLGGALVALALTVGAHAEGLPPPTAPACKLTLETAQLMFHGEAKELQPLFAAAMLPALHLNVPPPEVKIYLYLDENRVVLMAVRDGCITGVAKGSRKVWDDAYASVPQA